MPGVPGGTAGVGIRQHQLGPGLTAARTWDELDRGQLDPDLEPVDGALENLCLSVWKVGWAWPPPQRLVALLASSRLFAFSEAEPRAASLPAPGGALALLDLYAKEDPAVAIEVLDRAAGLCRPPGERAWRLSERALLGVRAGHLAGTLPVFDIKGLQRGGGRIALFLGGRAIAPQATRARRPTPKAIASASDTDLGMFIVSSLGYPTKNLRVRSQLLCTGPSLHISEDTVQAGKLIGVDGH